MLKKRSFHNIKIMEHEPPSRTRQAKPWKDFRRLGSGILGLVLDAFPSKSEIRATWTRQVSRVDLRHQIIKALHFGGRSLGDWDMEGNGRLGNRWIGAKHRSQQFHCRFTKINHLHLPNKARCATNWNPSRAQWKEVCQIRKIRRNSGHLLLQFWSQFLQVNRFYQRRWKTYLRKW